MIKRSPDSGRGSFYSWARGMTLQNLSEKPAGRELCGILAEPLPELRSALGSDVVITVRALGLHGRAGIRQCPSCKLCLQGSDWELFLCVADVMGFKHDEADTCKQQIPKWMMR